MAGPYAACMTQGLAERIDTLTRLLERVERHLVEVSDGITEQTALLYEITGRDIPTGPSDTATGPRLR